MATFSDLSLTHQLTLNSTIFAMNKLANLLADLGSQEYAPEFLRGMSAQDLIAELSNIYQEKLVKGEARPPVALCLEMDEQIAIAVSEERTGSEIICSGSPNNN